MGKWVALGLLFFSILFVVMATPLFSIREVRVTGENHYTEDQIRAMARLTTGKSFLRLNRAEAAARLRQDSWIQTAAVVWRPPHLAEIVVSERTPLARLYARGDSYLVADDGTILETGWRASQPGILEVMDLTNESMAGRRGDRLQFDGSDSLLALFKLLETDAPKLQALPKKVELSDDGHVMVSFEGAFPPLTFWSRASAPKAFEALVEAYANDPGILGGKASVVGITDKTLVVIPAASPNKPGAPAAGKGKA